MYEQGSGVISMLSDDDRHTLTYNQLLSSTPAFSLFHAIAFILLPKSTMNIYHALVFCSKHARCLSSSHKVLWQAGLSNQNLAYQWSSMHQFSLYLVRAILLFSFLFVSFENVVNNGMKPTQTLRERYCFRETEAYSFRRLPNSRRVDYRNSCRNSTS